MEELEAAAAVLAMANDSDDEEPRVAVDLSTSTAADVLGSRGLCPVVGTRRWEHHQADCSLAKYSAS